MLLSKDWIATAINCVELLCAGTCRMLAKNHFNELQVIQSVLSVVRLGHIARFAALDPPVCSLLFYFARSATQELKLRFVLQPKRRSCTFFYCHANKKTSLPNGKLHCLYHFA